eukprot:symbB.v1.2.012965.t1/scaffold906.1/size153294/10
MVLEMDLVQHFLLWCYFRGGRWLHLFQALPAAPAQPHTFRKLLEERGELARRAAKTGKLKATQAVPSSPTSETSETQPSESCGQIMKSYEICKVGKDFSAPKLEGDEKLFRSIDDKLIRSIDDKQVQVGKAPMPRALLSPMGSPQKQSGPWMEESNLMTGAEATFTVANFTMIVGLFTLPCLFARHGWSTGIIMAFASAACACTALFWQERQLQDTGRLNPSLFLNPVRRPFGSKRTKLSFGRDKLAMCNAPRSCRKAKTLPASILKGQCCLLDESDSPVRRWEKFFQKVLLVNGTPARRVRFNAQVTVNCIEKVQEFDNDADSYCKPSASRRALARLRALLSMFGCLQVRLQPERCQEIRWHSRRSSQLRAQSAPAIEVCWDAFIRQS